MSLTQREIDRFYESKIKEWMDAPYNFNRNQADLVYNYAYQELHAHWSDMVNYCDDYADLILNFLKLKD